MNKTNRDKNTEHDNKAVIRPKDKQWDFAPLEAAIKSWFAK